MTLLIAVVLYTLPRLYIHFPTYVCILVNFRHSGIVQILNIQFNGSDRHIHPWNPHSNQEREQFHHQIPPCPLLVNPIGNSHCSDPYVHRLILLAFECPLNGVISIFSFFSLNRLLSSRHIITFIVSLYFILSDVFLY